jgi:hypothetical protein
MKTKFYLPIIVVAGLLSFTSCKKESVGRSENNSPAGSSVILNASVNAGAAYKLNLSFYGNGDATIIKQATSYTVSQIKQDAGGNNIYEYATTLSGSKSGSSNTDQVKLKITSHSEGGGGGCQGGNHSNSASETNVTINFSAN